MTVQLEKHLGHVAVRYYRYGSIELMLVPLMDESASFTRSAGDGYFLVALMGEPGSSYPLDLRSPGSYNAGYLQEKFKLDRRGYGYTPEELAATLQRIAEDLGSEEGMDR
ncbi:MAG TPA: hypothetical protein PKD27_05405 [Tepidiformaceae bacterium]|nr:hypothetical protein [Tepidiformaceae bacterium]